MSARSLFRKTGDPAPLLLVAVTRSAEVDTLVGEVLPGVPWAYLDPSHPGDWSSVRAMLFEDLRREFAAFDPKTIPGLEFVQQLSTGLDRFPFARFPTSVAVSGNVGAFAPYVAEHALALALAAARDLRGATAMIEGGRLRPPPPERTLVDATAVILGYGAIGRAIAERLVPFGAKIVGLSRTGSPTAGAARMFSASQLREAVSAGSFVFEARPLTRATVGTIGPAELAAMRPDAVFVNVGRARTVDPTALYEHLRTHPEFRAASDVWWEEDYVHGTIASAPSFGRLPNFYGTPHCADSFAASDRRALRMALENIGRFFQSGSPLFIGDRAEYEGLVPP